MKLKTIIVLALAATISASAGAADREDILKDVAKMNAEMPMSMGMMGTMTSISVSGDTIVYNMTIDGLGSIDFKSKKPGKIDKKYTLDNLSLLSQLSGDGGGWYEDLRDCGMYLKYHYLNPHSRQQADVVISPKELSDALDNDPDYKFLTDYMIESTKSTLPMEVGAMKIVEAKLEGNNYVTTAIVDEDVISIERMIENQPLMKENFLLTMKKGAELTAIFNAYVLAKAGYTQVFKYQGSQSGKQVSYQVTPEEILNVIDF